MRRRSLLLALVVLACMVVGALPASAGPKAPTRVTTGFRGSDRVAAAPVGSGFSISRNDGNDVAGALDLRSMKITRGKARDTIVLSTFDAVSNTDIDPDNGNFAILIDTNDNRKYDFAQYVFFQAGKLRGVLVKLSTGGVVDRTAPVSRATPKAFRTVIQRGRINSPGTYRFGVFGYNQASPCSKRRPCIDSIPNRFPLIPLDHKAPTLDVEAMPAFTADDDADLTSPLEFTVEDDAFGTGVKTWTVQRKEVGTGSGWETVDTGRNASPTVQVQGAEGATYDVRVMVVDKQKNKKVSNAQRITFPLDDDSALYSASTQSTGLTGPFLGTLGPLANGTTATLTFTGSSVCVMGGPVGAGLTSTASVDLDAVAQPVLTETDATAQRERFGCMDTIGTDPHVLTLTGTSADPFLIDGFYVLP